MQSLDRILAMGGATLPDDEKLRLATIKNARYVEMIKQMPASEILPGAKDYLLQLRERGVKIALGSASKNAELILENLGIRALFDAVIDGNKAMKSKPDPQVFLLGAQAVGIAPSDCVVYEDAAAGIEAANAGGMYAVGIGRAENLPRADLVVPGLYALL
jgi:beta-phosphoglucomutase